MNQAIREYGGTTNNHNNEQWVINSNSPNECSQLDNSDAPFSSPEVNPLKYSPHDRYWIRQSGTNPTIQMEALILSNTLTFLKNAIKKTDGQNYDSGSFMHIMDTLKGKYNDFLDQ